MVRMNVFGKILAGVVVSGALIVGVTFGNPVRSPDSGKAPVTAKTETPAKQLKPQTTCPVTGEAINKSIFVDYKGKRIYLCCNSCIDPVKKDPEMYIKKLEKMGQSVETIAAKEAVAAAGPANVAAKDTATASKKCGMMNDSSKKKCPMMNDTSKVKGCYTCPMHPEVMQKTAGKCPKCGMDLVFQTCKMDGKGKGGCCKMRKQD